MRRPRAEDVIRQIGRRIAELRAERNVTQERLAEQLGVSVKYLQRVEAGRENLTIRSLVKIAQTLGVTSPDLYVAPRTLRVRAGRPPKR